MGAYSALLISLSTESDAGLTSGLAPIERQTLATAVIDRLAEHVTNESLGPGDRLPPQHELASRLGVSRPVLREALQGLESIGLLEIRHGSGVFVRDPEAYNQTIVMHDETHTAVLHVLEARMLVEVEMAALAAERMTPEDLKRIDQVLDRLKHAVQRKRSTAQITADFHRMVARSCHNSILYKVGLMLATESREQGDRVEQGLPDVSAGEYESHLRLRDAVASGDPDRARAETRRHLELAHGWEDQLVRLRQIAGVSTARVAESGQVSR
ncbi:MAG: FadR family transcriptional regulator [Thermomicrobiales bacterium]|nr:FadR family transcriptional regulator [Thermomicrobiales bacterium]